VKLHSRTVVIRELEEALIEVGNTDLAYIDYLIDILELKTVSPNV
jgi:hypothetical protein